MTNILQMSGVPIKHSWPTALVWIDPLDRATGILTDYEPNIFRPHEGVSNFESVDREILSRILRMFSS
jgi:hypothetical protein